jgi:hypothetical protein
LQKTNLAAEFSTSLFWEVIVAIIRLILQGFVLMHKPLIGLVISPDFCQASTPVHLSFCRKELVQRRKKVTPVIFGLNADGDKWAKE